MPILKKKYVWLKKLMFKKITQFYVKFTHSFKKNPIEYFMPIKSYGSLCGDTCTNKNTIN
jgi:hypothetical protein